MSKIIVNSDYNDDYFEKIHYLNWLIDYYCYTDDVLDKIIDYAQSFCPEEFDD